MKLFLQYTVLFAASVFMLLALHTQAHANNQTVNVGLAAVILDPDIGPAAIIEFRDYGTQDSLPLGAEIKPGMRITEISGKGIVIKYKNNKYTLSVGENLSAAYSRPAKITNVNLNNEDISQIAHRWKALADILSGTVKNPKRIITKGSYAGGARIEFYPTGVLKNSGLQKNDIITEINGKNISDIDRGKIINAFMNDSSVLLTVVRNGHSLKLAFEAL